MHILVVEDSPDILANIADYLALKGYVVDCASDGLTGLHLAATRRYDLIVLDVMMPGMDGFTFCKRLRDSEHSTTPVIILTARDALEDRLTGLGNGADDYLTKPFALSELVARIEAVLRRSRGTGARRLAIDDLRLDLDTLEVSRGGRGIRLTPAALKLLTLLMKRSPAVVAREQLETELWGDSPPDSDSLRSHIHALRRQIDKPFEQPILETVHGIGYRLVSHARKT